jgi:L-ascorbate metabolism protein UlaG (beta-lactamase superfamily)
MKMNAILLVIMAGSLIFVENCPPQESKFSAYTAPHHRLPAPANFFDKPEEYLNWQAQNLLDMVVEISVRFPPQLFEPIERHMAMLMLDAVFHDVKAPARPAVQEFHYSRIALAAKEIENIRVEEGAMIWKLYNMGFVVRTNTVTIGFDLTRGYSAQSEGFAIPDDLMYRIVRQCDVHFISHRHDDHADDWIAQTFLEENKPVVAPPDIWQNEAIYQKITHLNREAHTIQTIPIQFGKRELKVVLYPGHQGTDILNNVSLVITPEGMSFCHTGDQSNDDDFSWIDKVHEYHWIDVLLPNCWTTDPSRSARGYNPELIIPSHENELGHIIDHREAYGLDYSRWQVAYPKLIMTWGESFYYLPKAK